MQTKIRSAIYDVLHQFRNTYFIDGKLNKTKVIQDLSRYETNLLEALLKNETIKKNFTVEIKGALVLEIDKLIQLVETDNYWQASFTNYAKKIGLTRSGTFIDETTDVVLDFPFKDCVLKASMKKTETDHDMLKTEEVFLHEILAKEEIDVLFDEKIFIDAKKYDEHGVRAINTFHEADNFIIKGNNLLALHTLKRRFIGKVKLIYIDPPYNTGKDTFRYNDKFSRSTWLTFMKNRLEIARDFLQEDGVIFVHCDDHQQAYLKVLMDEIFHEENFLTTICYQHLDTVKNDATYFSKNHEFILCYAKQKERANIFGFKRTEAHNEAYKNYDNDPRGSYLLTPLHAKSGSKKGIYTYTFKNGITWSPPPGTYPRFSKKTLRKLEEENRIYFGTKERTVPQRKTYLSEVSPFVPLTTFWDYKQAGSTRNARSEMKALNFEEDFDTPKPEKLLKLIIESCTKEGDLVLDFFMGSATTQAVAHKLNRRYIGIEQMDYIETISVPRLEKVIAGEQGGISKDVDWQGGGSFVYVRLMEKKSKFLKDLQVANTKRQLADLLQRMLETADIDFRIDLTTLSSTLNDEPLDIQKRTLFHIIDKNQLYYSFSEIDDKDVRELISDYDYQFNMSFYRYR